MEEQGIPREHLSKMIALQKQTMSELYEKNVQLRKDKAELIEALQNYVDAIGNDRGLAAIGKCFKPAKELLERMK